MSNLYRFENTISCALHLAQKITDTLRISQVGTSYHTTQFGILRHNFKLFSIFLKISKIKNCILIVCLKISQWVAGRIWSEEGLIRSARGWQAVKAFRKNKIHLKGNERMLGDSDFVLHVLNEQNERMDRRFRLREQGYDIEKVIERVSKLFSLSRQK